MNAHALGILEYPRLLELVAGFAASTPGAARVRALTPSADLAWLEAEDGLVRDEASPALRRIRRELRASHGELIRILERVMGGLESHHRAPDMSVTVREGRYVIPVRREGVRQVGGIVHGASGTGGTLFVEPPAAIEYGNRIRELESEEQEEVERILRELTDQLRPHRDAMTASLDALAELDSLYARARYAVRFQCAPATLVPARGGFEIHAG